MGYKQRYRKVHAEFENRSESGNDFRNGSGKLADRWLQNLQKTLKTPF